MAKKDFNNSQMGNLLHGLTGSSANNDSPQDVPSQEHDEEKEVPADTEEDAKPRRGRRKGEEDKIGKSVYIPTELYKKIEAFCQISHWSFSEAVTYGLQNIADAYESKHGTLKLKKKSKKLSAEQLFD